MARDLGDGDPFVFDLVDGADSAEGTDSADGPDELAEGDPSAPVAPGRKRRTAALVAGVLAVLLGTGLTVDGALDQAWTERMRSVDGGLVDVSVPPVQTWAWEGTVGPTESPTDIAVLGDVLVFESDGDLLALDPATGDEAWRVRLGAEPDCGPMVSPPTPPAAVPSLVCLQGTGAGRAAITVAADGTTSAERVLDPADTRRFGAPHTGPDGTVLRARRTGPASDADLSGVTCDPHGQCVGSVEGGRDLMLRAENARTGAERWLVTIPFRASDVVQCTRTFGAAWGSSGTSVVLSGRIAPNDFGGRVTPELVKVSGCGVDAAVTPDGVVLGTGLDPGTGTVRNLSDGYAETNYLGATQTVLYGADGVEVGEITGYPLEAQASDESEAATLLAVDEPGRRLRAYESDGEPRWDITLQSGGQQFLAQVGGTAVITSGSGTAKGLDLETGHETWAWDGSVPDERDGGYFGSAYVTQAFTDGRSVLLLTEGHTGGDQGLVALDAESGAVVWERAAAGTATASEPADRGLVDWGLAGGLVAVDGNLLEVTRGNVRGLG